MHSRATDSGQQLRDYVAEGIAYARNAARPECKTVGKWIRLAAQRFLRDLDLAKEKGAPFTFSKWHAEDACDFIEKLPHVEGVWSKETIVLHPAQVFVLIQLFGFRIAGDRRRFSTMLFAVARKAAKSTLLAAIALYIYCCETETGPQVISAATTGDQARIIFNIAKRMVQKTADLREAFGLSPFVNAIACTTNGGTFKPISAKASTQDGLNPSATLLDEIHAHKTHDLLNVLKSAAGARGNPFFGFATTEGYENPGPWRELRHFAKLVLDGIVEADHFLAIYYAVDDADNEFDESAWIKANPLIDTNPILLTEIRKEAIEAKQMPGRLGEFKIKRLNRPAAAAGAWIDIPKWQACGRPLPMDLLLKTPCFGGLDLASTNDMTALRLVWRIDGIWYTWGTYWVPEDAVAHRTTRGTTSYAAWVEAGHIIQTEGNVTDYERVEKDIADILSRFKVRKLAFDKWNAHDLVSRLLKRNAPLVEFNQSAEMYHPAMQELERAYTSGKFCHGDNPVLNWNAANLVARTNVNMNMAPDKKKSADKIDGMSALLEGMGVALSEPEVSRPRVSAL